MLRTAWSPASLVATAAGVLVIGGCTSSTADEGSFSFPSSDVVECQEHQTEMPGTDYAGGTEADTAKVFAVLRYWTENGEKPYCDGDPPTEVDAAWRELVERLQSGEPAPETSTQPTPSQTT